jgi:hypothetical protein
MPKQMGAIGSKAPYLAKGAKGNPMAGLFPVGRTAPCGLKNRKY